MTVLGTVRRATCRVDYRDTQLGSAFWVDEVFAVTAAHVVNPAPNREVTIRTFHGQSVDGEVVFEDMNTDENPGSDLALLQTSGKPGGCDVLSLQSDLPSIGEDVMWSGYARLLGEPKMDRQRFGWGRVASTPYDVDGGTFFEVDGLFNPSHSGGPVVTRDEGDVVGIVSATAGGFKKLRELWDEKVQRLLNLFDLSKQLGGIGIARGLQYESHDNAVHDKQIFEELGLDVRAETEDDGKIKSLTVSPDEIPVRAGQVQAEISRLLLETAQKTFQMGVGIASGGDPLDDLLNQR